MLNFDLQDLDTIYHWIFICANLYLCIYYCFFTANFGSIR